ncbi:methionine ABC transporter ATP-binding protein [Cytobacillus firmus]|uniref:methionine ABC transporter ATP-binding protein n=1 Tax=Cytobacillus firmus TaxID=1399 RepID=UPI00077C9403|nr:methionine ABC transporter ATP-binding protein [Cytobacillus firmus]MBG9542337.1 phosphate ABC transporter ATP-binding protein [Cytobacillus firmus]MBG9548681.1 phosphate ABC transporter ATP-binding protein [Cytobacillus firmus]MBG9553604.1 phosphate ABC transporter ATP-binding protein [Cytobacillus firmus]MBG9557712.1 phosphate ABC transporter ATP-binding protein [Cytobacillus firmus]MBG9573938.1 phosphate ABC transporter ATP-binding protein [Cytobacillus firmus]
MIEFQNLKKVYNSGGQQVAALDGIDLKINKGEIFGVIGFSGAGKSSLIRCVNWLEKPTSGKVIVSGHDLTALSVREIREVKRNIGMVFQHFNLLNSKTVFANVAMPLTLAKVPKDEIKKRVHELLEFVGLADKANSYPDQLSGGQKQRIGIARALATQPSILLCDEATSALDPQTTSSILQLLKKINKEYNITILIITHEMSVIREICDRVAVIEAGKIIEEGTVFNVFSSPKTPTAKNFVSTVMNDQLPDSIKEVIKKQQGLQKVFRINFVGNSAGQPLLSQVAKKFNIDFNVLFGNITELQGTPFGNLIVEFQGPDSEIRRAIQYISQEKVSIKEVTSRAS